MCVDFGCLEGDRCCMIEREGWIVNSSSAIVVDPTVFFYIKKKIRKKQQVKPVVST